MTLPETFAAVLRRRREEKGWTSSQLARRADVDRTSIWAWEAGLRVPRALYRNALRMALGLSPHDDDGWWSQEWDE